MWFWFIFVGVLSVLSFFYWFFAILMPGSRRTFVERYLKCTNAIGNYGDDNKLVSDLVNKFLRSDGVFLLRLIQVSWLNFFWVPWWVILLRKRFNRVNRIWTFLNFFTIDSFIIIYFIFSVMLQLLLQYYYNTISDQRWRLTYWRDHYCLVYSLQTERATEKAGFLDNQSRLFQTSLRAMWFLRVILDSRCLPSLHNR